MLGLVKWIGSRDGLRKDTRSERRACQSKDPVRNAMCEGREKRNTVDLARLVDPNNSDFEDIEKRRAWAVKREKRNRFGYSPCLGFLIELIPKGTAEKVQKSQPTRQRWAASVWKKKGKRKKVTVGEFIGRNLPDQLFRDLFIFPLV